MQPLSTLILVVAATALVISAGCWLMMGNIHTSVAIELEEFSAGNMKPIAAMPAIGATRGRDLPAFSSGALIEAFHSVAVDVKLPVDEVGYTLDGSVNQPFLRYRVTLAVKTDYPQIRKFVPALITALPNVSLDSVRCAKDDVSAAVLSCQLGFSAFYRKSAHG